MANYSNWYGPKQASSSYLSFFPPQARIQRANVPSKQVLFNTKQPPAAAAGEHVDERKPENSKEKSKID